MNLTEIKNSSFDELVIFLDENGTEEQVETRRLPSNSHPHGAHPHGAHPLGVDRQMSAVRACAYDMYWRQNPNSGYTVVDLEGSY